MSLNYRHLHYFWVVAKEGGLSRAAERLGVAVQTVSAQVRLLEEALGHPLLKPAGRGLALTEAGQEAFNRAEAIFQLGQDLPQAVRAAASQPALRLAVGLSDGLSKLATQRLLAPVLGTPTLRLLCHDGEFEALLAELALHQLDLVLAGQPAPANPNLRLSSQRVLAAPVDWLGPPGWVGRAERADFPRCLERLPVLLPTAHAPLRARLDRWFEAQGLRPRVVGEFEDSALLAVFAVQGLGVFPLSRLGVAEISLARNLRVLGEAEGVIEEVHAIHSRRGQHHPLVRRLLDGDGPPVAPPGLRSGG